MVVHHILLNRNDATVPTNMVANVHSMMCHRYEME